VNAGQHWAVEFPCWGGGGFG